MHTEHEAPVQHKPQISIMWTPHLVTVTIGIMVIVLILGSSYIPIIPLLQGGGGPPNKSKTLNDFTEDLVIGGVVHILLG